jgi:uncharacterized protein YkwD
MSHFQRNQRGRSRLHLLAIGLAALAISGAATGTGTAVAASCDRANAEPNGSSDGAIADATLCLLNAERRAHGLSPLRLSRPLSQAAAGHSGDMVSRRYFAHTAPGGPSFLERVRHSGYLRSARNWLLGENLAWGTRGRSSARAIVRAWMHSPRHRKAILTPAYRDLGVGIAPGVPGSAAAGGATYTADFGVRSSE